MVDEILRQNFRTALLWHILHKLVRNAKYEMNNTGTMLDRKSVCVLRRAIGFDSRKFKAIL